MGGGGGLPWTNLFFAKRFFFSAARRRLKFLGFGGPKMRLPTLEIAHLGVLNADGSAVRDWPAAG